MSPDNEANQRRRLTDKGLPKLGSHKMSEWQEWGDLDVVDHVLVDPPAPEKYRRKGDLKPPEIPEPHDAHGPNEPPI